MAKSKKRPPDEPSNGVHDGPRITLPIPEQDAGVLKGRWLSEVQQRDVQWLLYPWIPLGMLTLLVGRPNAGKSTFLAALTSYVNGTGELDGKRAEHQGAVIILPGSEEDIEVTTAGRLAAAGVDQRKVKLLEGDYRLHADRKRLAATLKHHHAKLLLIDPVDGYMEEETGNSQGHHVRVSLEACVWIAKQAGAALVAVRHPGKDPNNVMVGHRQWGAVPRSIVELAEVSKHPLKYMISLWRDGLGTRARPREYTLCGEDKKPKRFVLAKEVDATSEEMNKAMGGLGGRWKLEAACRLVKWMFDGDSEPLRVKLGEEAARQGLGTDTVNEALRLLGVRSVQGEGRDSPWKMVRLSKEWPEWLRQDNPS